MRTPTTEVDVPINVQKAIKAVLLDRLGESLVNIKFQDIVFNESGFTIVIELRLRKEGAQRGGDGAVSLFGLTNKVRNAMGSLGEEVFPVLRPVAYHP